MLYELFPQGALMPDAKDCSIQSLLFGHRIKPQQTRYEYLSEFLQIVMSKKRIVDDDSQFTDEMFIINDKVNDHMIEYTPVSNMGLKRFIFFDTSRLDTKAAIDDVAYKKCVKILKDNIECDSNLIDDKDTIFVLQNILYGFSIENAGRSWFNKNLLPVCPEVLFPESLARKAHRENASIDSISTDNSFDFNSYTYMARGGEIYYLHLLHALNNAENEKKELLEKQLKRMLSGIPQLREISCYIQKKWEDEMDFYDRDTDKPAVKKTMKAIPLDYQCRDKFTVSELITFLDNRIQPMEKIDILSYGIVIQIFRMMITIAARGSEAAGSVWLIDVCGPDKKEHSEVKKLASHCFSLNEESFTKYIDRGIAYFYPHEDEEKINKRRKSANDDTIKVIRKLGKNMGMIIPMTGPDMRFTLPEEILKFLVMSLIPVGKKVTFDNFLDMLYDHFEIVISPEHYTRAVSENKAPYQSNVTFLQMNKSDFAQKLKNCGFLRDLSDATSIVENPYESEAD